MLSGTLPGHKIGDHTPIFEFLKTELPKSEKQGKTLKIYDFSNANLNKFVEQLSSNIPDLVPSAQFSDFLNLFNQVLDNTCKLAKPKETRRTPLDNPWITDGIAAAVNKKHELRKEWTDSITDKNPSGDITLRETFRQHRKCLQHIVNTAKNTYKCNKIMENKEDSWKTWQ